jgi:hypothetical protein
MVGTIEKAVEKARSLGGDEEQEAAEESVEAEAEAETEVAAA